MLMSEASTTESTSACDLLYFDHQVRMRQASYLDGRAGRKRDAQIIMPNIDVSKELVDIGHKCCGFDKISETCSRGFERRAEILSNLANLHSHIAWPNNIPRLVARELSGNKNE